MRWDSPKEIATRIGQYTASTWRNLSLRRLPRALNSTMSRRKSYLPSVRRVIWAAAPQEPRWAACFIDFFFLARKFTLKRMSPIGHSWAPVGFRPAPGGGVILRRLLRRNKAISVTNGTSTSNKNCRHVLGARRQHLLIDRIVTNRWPTLLMMSDVVPLWLNDPITCKGSWRYPRRESTRADSIAERNVYRGGRWPVHLR